MYIIKGFGALSREEQVEILKIFQGDEEMLFPYCVPDYTETLTKEDTELVEDLLEEMTEEYFQGWVYLYEDVERAINQGIKQIVSKYIENHTEVLASSLEELISEVKKGDFHQVNKNVEHDIKFLICHQLVENNFSKTEYEEIKQKRLFEGYFIFDEQGKDKESVRTWWYPSNEGEDIWKKIMFDTSCRNVMIIDKNEVIDHYSYMLVYYETAEDYDLFIDLKSDEDLKNRVIPKIAQVNKDIIANIAEGNWITY